MCVADFYVLPDASKAPLECSVLRSLVWNEEELADSPRVPPSSRDLARRVAKARTARWGTISGLRFEAGGVLHTPWDRRGRWGVLPDRPGTLFADFGGGQHELSWEESGDGGKLSFVSTRCSDGDVVRGSMVG